MVGASLFISSSDIGFEVSGDAGDVSFMRRWLSDMDSFAGVTASLDEIDDVDAGSASAPRFEKFVAGLVNWSDGFCET